MVLLIHVAGGWPTALGIYPGDHRSAPLLMLPPWLDAICVSAGHGVTLFFVVSAFTLMSRTAQPDDDLRGYALRRLARVGPGYWIAGLAYTLVGGLAPRAVVPNGISPTSLVAAAAFVSAWGGGASLAVVPGGWSVSCEMAFYIGLPLLVRLISGRIWFAITLTVLTAMIAELRAIHATVAGDYTFAFRVNPIQQVPVFLCGATAALMVMQLQLPRALGFASVPLLLCAIIGLPLLTTPLLPHVVFAIVVAGVVAFAAAYPPVVLSNRLIRRVGEVSYSMYLVHWAVLAPSLRAAEWLTSASDVRTMLVHFAFTVLGSFVIASVTYRCIERPAIRWAARRAASWSVKTPPLEQAA